MVDYLSTDRTKRLYNLDLHGQEAVRTSAHGPEKDLTSELNKLISSAYDCSGTVFEQVEAGLFYIVSRPNDNDVGANIDILKEITTLCTGRPYGFFVNQFKHANTGFFPFTLSITQPQALWDFCAGNLLITVVVDTHIINQKFGESGIAAIFGASEFMESVVGSENIEELELTLCSISEPEAHSQIGVSRHLFGRIGAEFLSLDWLLDELVFRYRRAERDGTENP